MVSSRKDMPFLTFRLELLGLRSMSVEDMDIAAILPSLPRLRSLNLRRCRNLTYRILRFLPSHLDLLDVSMTAILNPLPFGAEEMDPSSPSLSEQQGTREVKSLVAEALTHPRFGHFLRLIDGASVRHLSLVRSKLDVTADFLHFLANAPCLRKLELECVQGLDEKVFSSISHAASLRELDVRGTNTTDRSLALLASGPCRKSLRLINLTWRRGIENRAGVHRLFVEHFDRCEVVFGA